MGERKVLNKYYPPDFDPAKIPRRHMPRDRQYKVRLMAPFNMRCTNCGNYIYKGTKFNAMKETVQDESYLGLYIFRFYIRCTRCSSEIAFKTDPKNTDYVCEQGATRNFEGWRADKFEAAAEEEAMKAEEERNPMAALESRTKESRQEMDIMDALEEIKDSNERKQQVSIDDVIRMKQQEGAAGVTDAAADDSSEESIDLDEEAMVAMFFSQRVKRLQDDDEDDDVDGLGLDGTDGSGVVKATASNASTGTDSTTVTDVLLGEGRNGEPPAKKARTETLRDTWGDRSIGKMGGIAGLKAGLVRAKGAVAKGAVSGSGSGASGASATPAAASGGLGGLLAGYDSD